VDPYRHAKEVEAIQEVVPQAVDPTVVEREKSELPKFVPVTVMEVWPVSGAFPLAKNVSNGASYVKNPVAVP
jgi:hypothetical protein